jgi:uncharacterized membrane protein YqjE
VNSDPAEGAHRAGTTRGLAARVIQLVATRIELLGFELAEQRREAVHLLVLVVAGAVLALLGLISLTSAGLLALGPAWRPWGAVVLALAYLAGAVWALLRIRRLLRDRPPPFAATVAELKRDREWLETLK